MAAYAALLSLKNLLEQLQRHPRPPITLNSNQVETLTQKIAFLQDFLEVYNSHYSKQEVERLRNRIADVAYAAEDVIETHIVNRIPTSYEDNDTITYVRDLFVEVEDLQGPTADVSTTYDEDEYMADSSGDLSLEVYDEDEYMTDSSGDLSLEVVDEDEYMTDSSVVDDEDEYMTDSSGDLSLEVDDEDEYMTDSSGDLSREVDDEEEYMTASSGDLPLEVDDLHRASADASIIYDKENIGCINLHEVIRDMSFIEKEVVEIKDTLGTQHPQTSFATNVVAPKSSSTEHNTMVGFDDLLNEMLDKLTRQPHSRREIIPISGMGGIGKTTLARNAYTNPLTEYHFDILAWITISQEYSIRDILLGVLPSEKNQGSPESMSEMSEEDLGEMLYKNLCGRRYFIVMDDMWSPAAWDSVKRFFPNECNGSRIIVTTRLTNVASYLTTKYCGLQMHFLDQEKSWALFCKTVFGEEDGCPSEFQHIGKEISKNCKGLPLSIVVIGGLLAKSRRTNEYWEYIAKNLNSIVNLEENEQCSKILYTSYDQLPAHLKACFLYMAVFPEDHEIFVSELIRMWVAESFVKPISGKDLEESAVEYLMDLARRNLIMVHEDKILERITFCKIHDLLRDLCIREARKEKFICIANQYSEGLDTQRRIAIHRHTSAKKCLDSLKGRLTVRSLICYSQDVVLPLAELRLLRVFTRFDILPEENRWDYRLEDICGLVNMRYLFLEYYCQNLVFPFSISQLWNLQTLDVVGTYGVAPPEIWKLPWIRHISIYGLILPDPPCVHTDRGDDVVLHELRTLIGLSNLNLSEEMIKRIPNVNKLELNLEKQYQMPLDLNNLDRLYNLEDFSIMFGGSYQPSRTELMQNLTFPHSLKKLTLHETRLEWDDISTKIGLLPRLQMLILDYYSAIGLEWRTVEGQFCSLKYLKIKSSGDLKCWSTESTHFPCLDSVHLKWLHNLEEIPLCVGDIPTLKTIVVEYCSDSVVISAKRILDEQQELGNESLRFRIRLSFKNDKLLKRLESDNFQIETWYY